MDTLERLEYLQSNQEGLIVFDNRIDNMAEQAKFILDLEIMHILKQISQLSDEDIKRTLDDIKDKKQKKKVKKS